MSIIYRIWCEDTRSKLALAEVYYKFFQKHNPDVNSGHFVIPYDEFEYWRSILEKRVDTEEDTTRVNQRNSNITNVHIVDTSINNADKSFVEELRHTLEKENMIKLTETEAFHSEKSKYRGVVIVIVNTSEYDNVQQAVDNCLAEIREEQLKSTIVVVLHSDTELPNLSSGSELNSNTFHERYSKIHAITYISLQKRSFELEPNHNALQTIKDFCLVSNEQTCQNDKRRKEHNTMIQLIGNKDQEPVPNNSNKKQECKGPLYITDTSSSNATTHFVDRFRTEMKDIGRPVLSMSVENLKALKENVNLILICNNAGRIISDFESCVEKIENDQHRHTVVIVLHVGHKVPASTEEELRRSGDSEKFQYLRKIIDMMYDSENGICSCDLNTNAYKILQYLYPIRNEEEVTCSFCCIN